MRASFAALALAGCAMSQGTGPLSGPAMMRDVVALADPAMAGREAGKDGERAAVTYVTERLRGLGLEPVEQAVPSYGSANVHALLAGAHPEEVIVIGAHLDHLGEGYPGADDDASGVAAVLAIAETLVARQGELDRSVMFVLFGAEEQGLAGSRQFVDDPPVPLASIVGMINLDMIGRPLVDQWKIRPALYLIGIDRDRAMGLVGTRHYPGLRALADDAFAAEGGEVVAAEDLPARLDAEIQDRADDRSDATSFEAKGIPALFFGDGESRDYHGHGDTPGKLSPAVMELRARAIARVVVAMSNAPAEAFARSDAAPPRRKPPRGWYLPFGVVTGAAFTPDPSYLIGAEISLLHLSPGAPLYAGLYADVIRDTTLEVTHVSFGPEFGRGLFGGDAGYVIEIDGGEAVDRGVVARAFFGISPVTVTLRAGYLADRGVFGELALAFKFPLRLSR